MKNFILIIFIISPILAKTLCGDELVDALELVCSDRNGFYKPTLKQLNENRNLKTGIVEQCCTEKGCDYKDLTRYCTY